MGCHGVSWELRPKGVDDGLRFGCVLIFDRKRGGR